MIWATVSSQSCFCWVYRASPSLAAKNIINLILVLTIWWCPCVESSLLLLEEGICYDQCVLLAKPLAFALLHSVLQGQICLLLQVFIDFLFLLTLYSLSIVGCKEYNQSDFSIDHLVMSMCRVFSSVVGRGCLLWPVRSLGRTLLAFALLHSVLHGQLGLLLQVFLDFLILHSSPLWWRRLPFLVLVLEVL